MRKKIIFHLPSPMTSVGGLAMCLGDVGLVLLLAAAFLSCSPSILTLWRRGNPLFSGVDESALLSVDPVGDSATPLRSGRERILDRHSVRP